MHISSCSFFFFFLNNFPLSQSLLPVCAAFCFLPLMFDGGVNRTLDGLIIIIIITIIIIIRWFCFSIRY